MPSIWQARSIIAFKSPPATTMRDIARSHASSRSGFSGETLRHSSMAQLTAWSWYPCLDVDCYFVDGGSVFTRGGIGRGSARR